MRIIVDVPDNMREMCKWHAQGIAELTSLEVTMLAKAVTESATIPEMRTLVVRTLQQAELQIPNVIKDEDEIERYVVARLHSLDHKITKWEYDEKETTNESK